MPPSSLTSSEFGRGDKSGGIEVLERERGKVALHQQCVRRVHQHERAIRPGPAPPFKRWPPSGRAVCRRGVRGEPLKPSLAAGRARGVLNGLRPTPPAKPVAYARRCGVKARRRP